MYKYYSLYLLLIRLGGVLNVFFMISSCFFRYNAINDIYYIWIDIIILIFMIVEVNMSIRAIFTINRSLYRRTVLLRMFIEFIKLVWTILVMIGIGANF